MKIEAQNIAGSSSTQSTALNTTAGQKNYASAIGAGDQTEISGLSRAIQSFQSDRASRVTQLTALVRSGSYDVNPALISTSIVNEALAAGGQQPGVVA